MILEVDNWYLGYNQILVDCRQGTGGGGKQQCLILCHADVDALAAARILTYMLRADQIEYTLLPCATWASLQASISSTSGFASIVLLNVGGTRNLTKLFGDDSASKLDLASTKVYVLDGRRPVHLSNIYAEDHVVVFWDPTHGSVEELPSDGDNLSGKEEEDSESSSGETSSDSDDDDDLVDSDDDDDDEAEEEFGADQDDTQGVPQPKKEITKATDMEVDDKDDDDDDVDYDGEDEREETTAGGPTSATSPRKKTKKTKKKSKSAEAGNDTDSTHDLENSDEEDDDDDIALTPTQTTVASTVPPSTLPPMTPAERHRQRQDRLRLYYSHGSSYGSPTSFVAHRIASQLRFGNVSDLLWLCMVGVTDAWLQSRLDILGYAQIADALQDVCLKLFPSQDLYEKAHSTVYAEELLVGNSGGNGNQQQQNKTKLTFSERGRIIPQTDHRFFLLRSFSLLDAMQCSNYVSTQLQLWTKPGMQRLHELLARMGYPLEDCMQPFSFMKPSLRRRLAPQLAEYAEEFGLDELEFTSFVRVTGFSSLTSASDTCYAASALLECHQISASSALPDEQVTKGNTGDWDLACFHAAYDALGGGGGSAHQGSKGKATIQTGLQWAMKLQRLILATAVGLVSRNAITRLRHFRYAYVTEASSGSNGGVMMNHPSTTGANQNNNNNPQPYHVLAKPLALTRLAHYLMDMHRASGKWVGEKKAAPLILLAEQPATGTYLVLGQEMPEKEGHLSPNKFGLHFDLVAQTMSEATARLESFDSHVVEVEYAHAERFLEQLHYIMDSAV